MNPSPFTPLPFYPPLHPSTTHHSTPHHSPLYHSTPLPFYPSTPHHSTPHSPNVLSKTWRCGIMWFQYEVQMRQNESQQVLEKQRIGGLP